MKIFDSSTLLFMGTGSLIIFFILLFGGSVADVELIFLLIFCCIELPGTVPL